MAYRLDSLFDIVAFSALVVLGSLRFSYLFCKAPACNQRNLSLLFHALIPGYAPRLR
jgi:hypothetical protein